MLLYDCIRSTGIISCRKLGFHLNRSKSSIAREQQRIAKRSHVFGSKFFETEEGKQWLKNMILAAIMIFSEQCGVGPERISMFLKAIGVGCFLGSSSGSIYKLQKSVQNIILKYRQIREDELMEIAGDIDIVPGGDETFFANLSLLVSMDLKSSFIMTEDVGEDRKHKTWEKCTSKLLGRFRSILCFVSDRAQSLKKLSEKTYNAVSIPDLAHMIRGVSSVMKFAFSRIERSLDAQIAKLKKLKLTAKRKKELTILKTRKEKLKQDHQIYRSSTLQFSLLLHPYNISDLSKNISASVESDLNANINNIIEIRDKWKISDPRKSLEKTQKQIPLCVKQIDLWFNYVTNSLDGSIYSAEEKEWGLNFVLPLVYWKLQRKKSKSKEIQKQANKAYKVALQQYNQQSLTHTLEDQEKDIWFDWGKSMASMFQRTSSAIEGRNGWLSQMHFAGRGLTADRVKVQTTIHNYLLTRDDGTTAYERLTGEKPPDLFQYILDNMPDFPEPKIAKNERPRKSFRDKTVPL